MPAHVPTWEGRALALYGAAADVKHARFDAATADRRDNARWLPGRRIAKRMSASSGWRSANSSTLILPPAGSGAA
jgi:hypothetical protein